MSKRSWWSASSEAFFIALTRLKQSLPALVMQPINIYIMTETQFLDSPELSLKAKGLFLLMSKHPNGGNMTIQKLKHLLPEGADAIGKAILELKSAGFITYKRSTDGTGVYSFKALEL